MLDARQRAMLEEIGVKVWWPAEVPVAAEQSADAVAAAPQPAAGTARSDVAREPRPARPSAAPAVAARPVPAPAAGAGDVVLADAPRRLYGGSAAHGGWLIVADMPPGPDGRHGEPLDGDAGRLLDNMLRALQLHSGTVPVDLVRTHRGAAASAGSEGGPRPFDECFAAHAAAVAPRLVLAMGPLAAQSLLRRAEPLGKLRGQPAPLAALPSVQVVATYHPAYLLRNPADKARAWLDLCLAASLFDGA